MKKLIPILLIAFTIQLSGCASTQTQNSQTEYQNIMQQLLALHDEYVEAIKTAQLKSKDLVDIARFEANFAREVLGADLQNIPHEATNILDRYEKIAIASEGREMTNAEKGAIAGMRLRFIYKMGEWMVLTVGPGLIKALALALK